MKKIYLSSVIATLLMGCAGTVAPTTTVAPVAAPTAHTVELMAKLDPTKAPTQNFDLTKWKINLPMEDTNPARKGQVFELQKDQLNKAPFSHPQWFHTDAKTGAMIFETPNKAMTTPNSKNARSELRAMLATKYDSPDNNFVIAAHPNASEYGAIGGELSATLSVDHVSTSGNYKKNGAFSVVIGQIHGSKNEPLKISYRKLPEHQYGSLAWRYETNAIGSQYGKRKDIYHDVFGKYNLRKFANDPQDGIKLGEVFSYDVKVEGNIMHLTFKKNIGEANEVVKTYDIDLSKGNYKGHDFDSGYANDWMYFKAGVYNQCNIGSSGCSNNGIEAGDYAKASFYQLNLNQ